MTEKLKMHSVDCVERNIEQIAKLFPNTVTEVIKDGKLEHAIDFDVLKQELSNVIVEGREERYQFTWPEKKKAILAANAPISATLRPIVSDSVGKDGTNGKFDSENLYIEGDNLEVLKLLQETYLGKIKMIYIDPPYNTGNDFVYEDNFAQNASDYMENSGQYDDEGNRMLTNMESNGRFHTDWLNMMYPRLKLAKDLLTNDGVLFISIDDNENDNLRKICDEVFGETNFVAIINWKGRGGRQDSKYYAAVHEYILCYAKNKPLFKVGEEIKTCDVYPKYDETKKRYYKTQLLRKWGSNSRREDRPNLFYPITAPDRSEVYPIVTVKNGEHPSNYEKFDGCWRHGASTMRKNIANDLVEFVKQEDGSWIPYEKIYEPLEGEEKTKKYTTWIEESNDGAKELKALFENPPFDYPKNTSLICKFLKMADVEDGDIILDFFSGSATTAHAVMKLNAEDGGHRKFIMVQLPEACDEKSEAFKAGYKNICEIGKERIRRAGKKIKEENPLTTKDLDVGFRCLRLDSSNMKDVYYKPSDVVQSNLTNFVDNVKEDRTSEDLLFQVMLDMGIPLSSEINVEMIDNKKVYIVGQNNLVACFDTNITEETVTAIAKMQPSFAIFKDSGFETDSLATNFDQIFETYSSETKRNVL